MQRKRGLVSQAPFDAIPYWTTLLVQALV